MKIFEMMRSMNGEIPSSYNKKDTKQRAISEEERALLDRQADQLDRLTTVAEEQFALSKEDRARYEEVFINADTPEAQEAMADLQERLTGKRPTGQLTTETLLRDVLIGSSGEMKKATEAFVTNQQQEFDSYKGELSGLSNDFVNTIKNVNETYQGQLQTTKDKMGTIDQDILSREKGAGMGGISSAYSELRKQQSADLARRGLAGSGAEISALSQTYQAEARDKAGAMAQARMQSLGLSDQRRMQQMGISGQQAQIGQQSAGQAYGVQSGVAGQLYGQQGALNQGALGMNIAANQQGISNLQSIQGASQGIYVGSQNYLGQAASSYGTNAQISGSAAANQGQLNNQWNIAQMESNAQAGAGFGSLAGSLLGTGGISSLLPTK
jgi:hypothetical protein